MEPTRSYVICAVQRTGSWLLAHSLADTGCAGRPSDYFDEAERQHRAAEWGLPADDLDAYVRAVREHATTPNGVLGSKLHWNTFDQLRATERSGGDGDLGLDLLTRWFPRARFVWLRREDKVRQGVSWWRGVRTDQWALTADQEASSPQPTADADGDADRAAAAAIDEIMPLVRFAQECEDGWRHWFATTGIEPHVVVYEDLARDRLGTVNAVLDFLDLDRLGEDDLPPVRYRKQADDLSERYVDLVRAALQRPD